MVTRGDVRLESECTRDEEEEAELEAELGVLLLLLKVVLCSAAAGGKMGEMVMLCCSSGARRARDAIRSSGSIGVVASAGGDARPVRSDSGSGPCPKSLSRQPTAPK